MRKKGFTLIELLAVIIILAIIALIATPIILDVVDDAKKSARLSEANMIYSGITNYCSVEQIKSEVNSNFDKLCTKDMTEKEVMIMVNLGNAKILEMEYINKLTWLKIESNGFVYSLQDNKMIEGNLEKPIPSFANDSWETIADNVKKGNTNIYNVGDTKEITLTGEYAGTYTVRIANMSTPEECSAEGFSQTACGFVIEFVDIITTHVMNPSTEEYQYGTNKGGWPASDMYRFLNTDIYNALPNELKKYIINTYTISSYGYGETSNFSSTDKLYLLSTKEVWGKNETENIITSDSAENETRQLDYYKNNNVTTSNYSKAMKIYNGNATSWWLRTAGHNYNYVFYAVYSAGRWDLNGAIDPNGVAPAFRIG